MKTAPFVRAAHLAVLSGLCIAAPSLARPGGGGSSCVFSLDPASPSALGLGGGALFRDDPVNDGMLSVVFTGPAIGLPPGANLDGVSGGRDDGIPAILAAIGLLPNPMDNPAVIYQYSVGRGAIDGVSGAVPIPFVAATLVTQRADYGPQFTDSPPHPQADIFDNRAIVGRWNFPMVLESGPVSLELMGVAVPPAMQDNVDAFTSEGCIGGDPDTNGNGQLDAGRRLYWSVAGPSPLNPATVYTVVGNDSGPPPIMPYATAAMLGLGPGNDIDAISIWDTGPGGGMPDGVFGPGDAVIFSLTPGSALVAGGGFVFPGDPGLVPIDAGGVFLALPGLGIVTGLPGGYFCQAAGSNLDAILALDPRVYAPPFPCGPMGSAPKIVQVTEALRTDPVERILEIPGMECNEFCISVNNLYRADVPLITSYSLSLVIENPAIARIDSANSVWCACGCGDAAPPCMGPAGPGTGATISGAPVSLAGQDICLAIMQVCAVSPGATRIFLSGSGSGPMGMVTFAPTEIMIRVEGTPPPPPCYVNCDGSSLPPVLNVQDFACFLNRYAAGDAWANCDGSVAPPTLNVLDFSCFLNLYAAGCT